MIKEYARDTAALTVKAAGRDNAVMLAEIEQLRAEVSKLKGVSDNVIETTGQGALHNEHGYNDKSLNADIATLLKCSTGNRSKISNAKKPAKQVLGIAIGRGVPCTPEQNRAIFKWIESNN
ncbi:MAG: hypothetical protein QM500_05230 [Methylococcales bacterium]